MDSKKIIIVICLAGGIAICTALLICRKGFVSENLPDLTPTDSQVTSQNAEQTNSLSDDITQVAVPKTEKVVIKTHSKPTVTPKTNTPNKQNTSPLITNTSQNIDSEKKNQPVEITIEPEVYQDKNSADIIITTEYKIQSPAKYSFK